MKRNSPETVAGPLPERTGTVCGSIPDYSVLALLVNRRVFIETHGCRYNFGDTAKLAEVLRHRGCTIVDTEEEADAVIVNTCTVVGPTERRMLRRLSALRDRELYVTGCMPAVQREAILATCEPVIIPPETIQASYRQVGTVPRTSVGIVQLAQGCDGSCTYCITRVARGPLRSFPADEIRRQVRAYAGGGTVEIQLTAQDAGAYGRDTGQSLASLLASLADRAGHSWIRVGMMNPATVLPVLDELVEAFAGERIFRFIHLPVQSGSDTVLERMGRRYTVEEFETIVAAFRRRFPDITLATDIIAGFPGESEKDFSASLDLVRRTRPDKVNVTRYSRRPFTPISQEHDYPDAVRKDRSRLLLACAEEVYIASNARVLGTEVAFIVTESVRKGSVMARSPAYRGIVINETLPPGYEGRALLTADRKYFFIGERVA
jgi:threonylcarbamoyladenosine tRNA methylthiotransferase CDKAL1